MLNRRRPRSGPKIKSSASLSFQRSLLRWNDLRRLRKGLVRARHHSLRSGANRINEEDRHGGRGIGLSLVRRVTRAGVPLIFIALLLMIGRRYTVQQLDVEKILRQQVIPQLEAQYHTKIEVGPVESDWINRVVLHDVVIGRDLSSPLGALAKARTVTVNLDVVGLALRRMTPLEAVNAVTVDEPQAFLLRDAKGHLNWQDLISKNHITGKKWRGRLTVRDGRIWYEDHALKSASGKITLADARGLNAEAIFNGDGPIQFAASAQETYLGPQKVKLLNITAKGAAGASGDWSNADLSLPPVPATLLVDYAFPNGDVTAQNGTLGANLTLAWDKNLPKAEQIAANGELIARNVALQARQIAEPSTNNPLTITNINGPVSIKNSTLETRGALLTALNTNWRTAGTIALSKPPVFDVIVQSDSIDTRRLIRLAKSGPLKNNRDLQAANLSGGRAQMDMHLTGDQNGARFSGTVGMANFSASHTHYGRAKSDFVRAFLEGSANQQGAQFTTRLTVPNLTAQQPHFGTWQSGAFGGDFKVALAKNAPARIEGAFKSSDVLVASNGARARVANLAGNLKLAATAEPHIEVTGLQMREVRGTFKNDTVRAATFNADLKLAGEKWDSEFRGSDISALVARNVGSAATLNGQIAGNSLDFAKARVRSDFHATNLLARTVGQGTLRADYLDGATFWAGNDTRLKNLPGGRLWSRADLKNASGAVVKLAEAGAVNGRAALAKIVGRWANLPNAQPAAADVTLVAFAGKSARYGAVGGQNLRVIASTPDAPSRWNGQAVAGALDISQVNLAALSPQTAREVSNIGTVSGKVNFANAGAGQMPTVNGNVRLSRVTLRDVNISDVSANIHFDGTRLRVEDAIANSDMGAVSGNLETALGANGLPDLQGLRFTFGTQNLTIHAAQINPYLKAQKVQASGTATGSVRLSSTGTDNIYQARFDLQMPVAALRPLDDPRPTATALLTTARVRGSGAVRYINANDWQFTGETVFAAQNASFDGVPGESRTQSLDGFGAPLWLHGSRGEALRIALRGSITHDKNGIQPQVAGDLELANVNFPLPPTNTKPLSLREARAEFVVQPDALNLSRLTAYSFNGELNGHAKVALDGSNAVQGQILAEKMDMAQVRAWISPLLKAGADDWSMRGTGFLQADFSGTRDALNTKVQARLYDGAARVREMDVPLDVVRTAFTIRLPDWKTIPIESLAVWSRGARISTNGTLTRGSTPPGEVEDLFNVGLDLKATLTDLRATRLNEIPAFVNLQKEAGIDGLLSAEVQVKGTVRQPKVAGRTAVRLAQAFGINIAEAQSDLTASVSADGPLVELHNISGRAEGTSFSGSLAADYPRNVWTGKFATEGLSPGRVLRAADDLTNLKSPALPEGGQVKFPLRTLPVRGALAANISLSGQLDDLQGKTALQNTFGTVEVRADDLRWRGLPLGTLTADLALQNGLLKTRQLELTRDVPAKGPLPAGKAVWKISGALPALPDAPGLDAKLSLDDERLAFFFDALEEARDALKLRAVTIPILDQVVATIQKLPPQLNGKVSLVADLKGRWSKPMVRVENLSLREAHAQGPLGADRELPVLDAAFDYDGQTVTIQNAALRLLGVKLPSGEQADDTVLRIAEGGKFTPDGDNSVISLQARLINANLSQLAPWVPALRDEKGLSKLTGDVQQFAFEVSGTLKNPHITGAVTAQNINFSKYTIDLLRINRFDIGDGFFEIQKPNLTVTKGAFQSSAASGRIPWSWEKPGPRMDAPLEIHLPLGRDDLGALAGTFIPALARADADSFSGEIDISGTAIAPHIGGAITISDGRFLVDPKLLPFDAGLTGVTGKITFSEMNRVTISGLDGTGDLTGRLVPPASIVGKTTGNPPAELREVSGLAPTITPATAATAQMTGQTPQKKAEDAQKAQRSTKLSGAFSLGGDMRLATNPVTGALSQETFTRAVPMLSQHRYNLHISMREGGVSTGDIAGLRNINFAAFWQTREGEAGHAATQRVRWMLGAQGTPERKQTGGAIYSLGAIDLASNFADGFEEFSRSRVRLLDDLADFEPFAVYRQVAAPSALGILKGPQPGRVAFKSFLLNIKGLATGQIDGTLSLDNRAPRSRNLPTKPKPSVAARVSAARAALGSRGSNEFASEIPGALLQETQSALLEKPNDESKRDPLDSSDLLSPGGEGPIRVAGTLVLSQATLSGSPVGGVSAGGLLPPGPMLDLSLEIGRAVQFSVTNVRAVVTGKVDVTGTPADPLVSGKLTIPSGSIRFPTAQARILKGELGLTAYRDKNTNLLRTLVDINASARGQVGKYTITIEIVGPLDLGSETNPNLKINVTSNPPLSEEQARYQLLGLRGQDLTEESYKDAIIAVVSSPLLSGIEQSLQRIFGLDTLALEYRFNEPLTVQVGKSFGDRIYVSYRRVLGDQIITGTGERYTLRMEYRLRNDVQLGVQKSDVSNRVTVEKTWRF